MPATTVTKQYKTVTEAEAVSRGYTHVTSVYRKCEFHLMDRAIADLAGEAHLLVVSIHPPGLSIWRPKNRVHLG